MIKINLRPFITVVVILVAVIVIIFSLRKCNSDEGNTILLPNTPQKTEVVFVNDSIKLLRQLLYESHSRNLTTDSLLKLAIQKGGVKPNELAVWRSVYSGEIRNVQMQDSLNNFVHKILNLQQDLLLTSLDKQQKEEKIREFEHEKSILLATRIPFVDSTKYRFLKGSIGFNSKINIDEDKVISQPYVVFGERKYKNPFRNKEITALVGDKNPKISIDSPYTAYYKPEPKLELSIGTTILANKNEAVFGPSLQLKKGIFHFNVGYNTFKIKY